MPRHRLNKKLTLYINKDVIEEAKLDIKNLSAFVELELREFLTLRKAGIIQNPQCGGWDLNPRTPTGGDLESPAFGLARQPPLNLEFS